MSRNAKIILAIGAGALLLCCCLILVGQLLITRLGGQMLEGAFTEDSGAAAATGQGIVDHQLPADFTADASFSALGIEGMIASSDSRDMAIIIFSVSSTLGVSGDELETQMRSAFAGQSGAAGSANLTEIDQREVIIAGQTVTAILYEGTAENGETIRQLVAPFEGNNGPAMLMIAGSVDDWDEDTVDTFIASMQ